jgi:hypothetical protein
LTSNGTFRLIIPYRYISYEGIMAMIRQSIYLYHIKMTTKTPFVWIDTIICLIREVVPSPDSTRPISQCCTAASCLSGKIILNFKPDKHRISSSCHPYVPLKHPSSHHPRNHPRPRCHPLPDRRRRQRDHRPPRRPKCSPTTIPKPLNRASPPTSSASRPTRPSLGPPPRICRYPALCAAVPRASAEGPRQPNAASADSRTPANSPPSPGLLANQNRHSFRPDSGHSIELVTKLG